MGFLTPMYELGEYLSWTRSGEIQLPDFSVATNGKTNASANYW